MEWQIVDRQTGHVSAAIDGGGPLWDLNGGLEGDIPQWSADSQWLYFRKLHGEEVQVWRASRDGRQVQQITLDTADVLAFRQQPDGELYYLVAGATRDEIKAAEKAEFERGTVLDGSIIPGFPISASYPHNGRKTTYRYLRGFGSQSGTLLGNEQPVLYRLDSAGQRFKVDPVDAEAMVESPWAVGSGRFILSLDARIRASSDSDSYLSPSGGDAALLSPNAYADEPVRSGVSLQVRSASGRVRTCPNPVCIDPVSLAFVGWSPDGGDIVFQSSTLGTDWLGAWDVRADRVRVLQEREGVLGSHGSGRSGLCQMAGNEVLCLASGASETPKLVEFDVQSGKERVLFDPNPSIRRDRIGPSRTIPIKDSSGSEAHGRLVLPLGYRQGTRLPLVISTYACPGFLQGGSGRDVPEHVFAGMGYAALCLDTGATRMRRPLGYYNTGKSTFDLIQDGNDHYLDMLRDVVRQLDEQGIIDPRRVASAGFSGSSTQLQYALTQTDQFTAAMVMTKGSMDAINCYFIA
ncbi:MAG: hypothetical protein EON93_01875, partial [Burkholderiales bacterium]